MSVILKSPYYANIVKRLVCTVEITTVYSEV